MEAIVRNHGFVDGNKRTSVLLLLLLLERSGYGLPRLRRDSTSRELEELVVGLADRTCTFDDACTWLKNEIERVQQAP